MYIAVYHCLAEICLTWKKNRSLWEHMLLLKLCTHFSINSASDVQVASSNAPMYIPSEIQAFGLSADNKQDGPSSF